MLPKLLFCDGTGGFDPHRLASRPCGGIITSLTLIPQYLASKGFKVTVASEYAGPPVNGVEYINAIREEDKKADVVVFNRNLMNHQAVNMFPNSYKVWWLHDIVDYRYMEDASYHRMDKIVSLSDYCTESYSDFFGIQKETFVKIPNGVDKSVFYPDKTKRNENLFVTASATIKGIYPLSFAWRNLKRLNPRAELRVYSSQKLHDREDGAREKLQLEQLASEGATICEPITQRELADVFRQAQAVLFPSHYPEICSNLVLQALACGSHVVSTKIGSVAEFAPLHYLTRTTPADIFWWWKDFAFKLINAADDRRIETYNGLSWDEVGKMWESMLKGRFN